MNYKLDEELVYVIASAPYDAGDGAIKGNAVDRLGFGAASFVLSVGTGVGSPGTFTVDMKIQESDTTTDNDFEDIAGASITQLTGDSGVYDGDQISLNLENRKRYLRSVTTVNVTTLTSVPINVLCILGSADKKPVTQIL